MQLRLFALTHFLWLTHQKLD